MVSDRYLKLILTVIAGELLWLAVAGMPVPASAQAPAAPTPVVIRGIDMNTAVGGVLPVAIAGSLGAASAGLGPLTVAIDPAQVLRVQAVGAVKIEADAPLRVESVPYTPSARPGQ